MKKIMIFVTIWACALCLSGCVHNKTESGGENTKLETEKEPEDTYYEMSDGTWKTDEHAYKYKLEITGRIPNAAKDTTYVILSNQEDITFEQAWKASGLSSNKADYFNEEDAVIVETR